MPQAGYVEFESKRMLTGWWPFPDSTADEWWIGLGNKIIEDELAKLPEGKRSYDNIYLAGFSMGAAAAVATHSKWDKATPLKGIFAGSAWNPFSLKDFADNVKV